MVKILTKIVFALSLFRAVFPATAHAYLDPGTGSYVTQILIASIAGVGIFARSYWSKIRDIIKGKKGKNSSGETDDKAE